MWNLHARVSMSVGCLHSKGQVRRGSSGQQRPSLCAAMHTRAGAMQVTGGGACTGGGGVQQGTAAAAAAAAAAVAAAAAAAPLYPITRFS